MSVEVMAWAWKQELPTVAKFVLLALADHADHRGVCWPGQAGIAEKCGVSRETVSRAIKLLESKRLLKVEARADDSGRKVASLYHLIISASRHVTDDHMDVTQDHRVCDGRSHTYVTDDHISKENRHKEPSREPSVPTRRKPRTPVPEDFGLTVEDRQFAFGLGLDADKVREEFVDYWRGEGALKSDWHATYRNRCRQLKDNPRFKIVALKPSSSPYRSIDDYLRASQ